MRVLSVMVLATLLSVTTPGQVAPAVAAEPTTLVVTSTPGRAGEQARVTAVVTDAAGAPVPGASLVVERAAPGAWAPVGTAVTDATGAALVAVVVSRQPGENTVRVSYVGDAARLPAAAEHLLALAPSGSRLQLRAPARVVDETSATLSVRWSTDAGEGVAGTVTVQQRAAGRTRGARGGWRPVGTLTTDADGAATLDVAPRVTTRYRAVATAQPWVVGAGSGVQRVRNVPPVLPVRLPRHAPRPRISLPPQPRAVGAGANPVVRPVPPGVWRQMVGRSWHAGCPVGREQLRLVQLNYWSYDGYRRRGELVVNAAVTRNFVGAFTELYERRLPVRAMYRVDRFGWSPRLRGANDYASMAAGNTSVFNCRSVVNNPGVRSPHSWGRSLDLNTWENPYRSRTGLVPNAYWQHRSHPRYAWRSSGHQVVALMRRHGFRWTYGLSDTQHFDAVAGAGPRLAARLAGRGCAVACD